ncbi:phosphoribosylaminoimidazolesuccinocarboxamide synthase [Aureivirga sp. CE67]|uniref:phosphoribosylaminoimidazolesuccinocarboxamide synthase n=1 Tax=Aureivirga sp. CE67 TaxID=1788983 RepID=UPI0018CA78C2|nr:phosphoribosylaminoimidazolesuccinocarboxamide synthase [Aureivirga sp. CE67]
MKKTFKTKTGFCHILDDKIVFTNNNSIENLSNLSTENNIIKSLILYALMSILFFYLSYESFKIEHYFSATLLGIFGLLLIIGNTQSTNNSSTKIIERNRIKEIKFKKANLFITRSRFEVFFEDKNNKIKKRMILLPGSLSKGMSETEKALEIMKEENLFI